MKDYEGRELQFYLRICHEDGHVPVDYMKMAQQAVEYEKTGTHPKQPGVIFSSAASSSAGPSRPGKSESDAKRARLEPTP
eukprot:422959-Pyramimonas_sp.AAC.1